MARYRRSPRRSAGLRRDLSGFDLGKVRAISVHVCASEGTELTLELVTRDRISFRHKPIHVWWTGWQRVEAEVKAFAAGEALRDVVGLWIRDTSPAERAATNPTTMVVRGVAFRPRLLGMTDEERPVVIDAFGPLTDRWSIREGPRGPGAPARVADTGERAERPELALHLERSERRRRIRRGVLGIYGLANCERLTFKARADRACRLSVHLRVPHERDWFERLVVLTSSVEVKPTERRKGYSVPLAAFEPEPGVREFRRGDVLELEFAVPEGVDFWLDNVAFVREPRGPRVGGISVMYEVFKLIHVAVPSLVAFVVFALLLFALRVEEARSSWEWLREKALKKVMAKLGRKG
jgi:hypothetical protein